MAIDDPLKLVTPLKVAVVGNMNNGMFALARHLRDQQVDAHLLFSSLPGHEHFHPKADTFDLADLAFCHQVSWLDDGFYGLDPDAVRADMRGYDAVLATSSEAAALSLAAVPIDIYFPYGEDVLVYAHLPRWFSLRQTAKDELKFLLKGRRPSLKRMRNGVEHRNLRRAICAAEHVIDDWENEFWDQLMLSLPLRGTLHRSAYPFLYPAPYRGDWAHLDVHWRSEVDRVRDRHNLMLLYHGRHEWMRPSHVYSKNTHHLIQGFGAFLKEHPEVDACLVTLEYGQDVGASKTLIAELGLTDRVVWFPLMYRKDLMYLVSKADLCSGLFEESYLTFGQLAEALSLGKPVIHYRDDSLYPDVPLYPILNARQPHEIAAAIAEYAENRDWWNERALEGQAWFDEYIVRRPVELICRLLGGGDRPDRLAGPQETAVDAG